MLFCYQLAALLGDPAVWQRDRLAELPPLHVALRLVHVLADVLIVGVALLAPHAAALVGHAAAGVQQAAPGVVGGSGRGRAGQILRLGVWGGLGSRLCFGDGISTDRS
jgi:hypothetical protein